MRACGRVRSASKARVSFWNRRARRGLWKRMLPRGVAEVELLAGFLREIVVAVFGFPEAVGEAEVIEQRAIHAERVLAGAADFPFRDKGPVVLAGAMIEQALESGADGGFVGDAEVVELAQSGVVILDRLVRGLQFQPLHGCVLH
jgi:hypothetical protein